MPDSWLEEYEFSPRATAALASLGVRTREQFYALDPKEVLTVKGAGRKTVLEIESAQPVVTRGIRVMRSKPKGWLWMTGVLRETEKAVQCTYYDWVLWFPKQAVVYVDGFVAAPRNLVSKAKDFSLGIR